MKKINIISSKSSGLHTTFNAVSNVEMDDHYFDKGAFGELYMCHSVNGVAPPLKQVIKILTDDGSGSAVRGYNTILKLQDKILSYNSSLKQTRVKSVEQVNALGALPQFSFEGTIDNKAVFGYAANFLASPDWLLFGKIFNEEDETKQDQLRSSFYNLPVMQRLQMAYDLVEGFFHLSAMNFIYADLNPQNFFVNQSESRLCLIDYEGGAVNDEPETFGKMGEWLAPEIQEQLTDNQPAIKVSFDTDTWAVMVGVHFMLFPYHPLFYLKRRGKKTMPAYFTKHVWPEADKKDPNFRRNYTWHYNDYLVRLNKEIPPSLTRLFDEAINKGYADPARRPGYSVWMQVIGALMYAPVIEEFTADRTVILVGLPVKLTWKINNALSVFLNGNTDVTGQSSIEFLPDKNTAYHLRAVGRFGEAEQKLHINVLPLPVIETLKVPMPDFEKNVNLSSITMMYPSIRVSMDMLQFSFTPPPGSFTEPADEIIFAKPLFRRKNQWSVSAVFNSIKSSLYKIMNSL